MPKILEFDEDARRALERGVERARRPVEARGVHRALVRVEVVRREEHRRERCVRKE